MHPQSAFLARQPIFDHKIGVHGYEILFRACAEDFAHIASPEHATAEVGVHALLDVGLDDLVGDRSAWINVPREILVSGIYEFFPPERVVLELLETLIADREVLASIERAKALGFKIALDDFVLNGRTRALVDLADYVKLDVLALGADGLGAVVRELRRPGLPLLAEKVETHETFQACKKLGFELFQGFFFAKPQLVGARYVPNNRMALLRVVCQLQDAQASLEQIEELIRADVGLSYRLMRYVNSVAIGTVLHIESIRHAIMTLGFDRVRACVMVLILTACEDKPNELVATCLIRARYCQLLCQFAGLDPQRGFLVGLMSAIDAFLDRKLEEIVLEIGLAADVERALIHKEGELGAILAAAIACETADWRDVDDLKLDPQVLRDTYVEALQWSAQMQSSLAGI